MPVRKPVTPAKAGASGRKGACVLPAEMPAFAGMTVTAGGRR